MTDLALPAVRTLDLASDAAKARVRARYRAEARFKFYGLAAIGLTAVFLVVVLADIVVRGLPAFWQHRLLLDVTVDRGRDRPAGNARSGRHPRRRLPGAGAQRVAGAISRGRATAPAAGCSTASCRPAPPIALRERVVADPSLIGQTVKVPVLISDDADLYYKGIGTRIERRPGRGIADPERHHRRDHAARARPTISRPTSPPIKQALVGAGARPAQGSGPLAPGRPPPRGAQGRARTRACARHRRPTSIQADLTTLSGEIEILSQKVKELDDAGGGAAGALRRRRRSRSRSTTSSRACWSRSMAGLSRSPQLGNAQGRPAPCCCRCNRPRTPVPAPGRS